MGLKDSKLLGTLAADDSNKKDEAEEAQGRAPLDAEYTTTFRAMVERSNYMAQGRAELQIPVGELRCCMSAPDVDDWVRLKRLVRYLVDRPRAVMKCGWQKPPGGEGG